MTKSKLNIEQLKKLQKDYVNREKSLMRRSIVYVSVGNFHAANDCSVRSGIYEICARDIKSLLDGVVLYEEVNITKERASKVRKILKAFNKA
jgi:hypothetical protein